MFDISKLRLALSALLLVGVGACTAIPDENGVIDPYEPVNRQIHAFNKFADTTIARPVGGALAQLPPDATQPIINFADNVGLPGMALNGLLQLDLDGAVTNSFRFIINSTVGIGGLFDPASVIGITEQETDFGETLAVWGVPAGAYIELPFYGPSNERDALGRIVDFFIDPLDRVGLQAQIDYGTYARIAGEVIDRGRFGVSYDSVLYDSVDSYIQTRLIYAQNRRFELGQSGAGAGDTDFVDPFEDF